MKYEVLVAVFPHEVWTVEANSPEEAMENYTSGVCSPELEWSCGDVQVLEVRKIDAKDEVSTS